MSPREARVLRNEELFRQVNLNIAALETGSRSFVQGGLLPLLCECVHTGCTAPIEVDPATFEQTHERPLHFLVAPGHEDPSVESIVEQRSGYLIVRKHAV
jgi:hypothetical protein